VAAIAGTEAEYQGVRYRHFASAPAKVTAVVGEFPWTVRVGDTAVVDEWVAPPLSLSREVTKDEHTLSTGEYVDGNTIWKAFGLKDSPPDRIGVGASQPSPYAAHASTMFVLACAFVASVVLVHLVFSMFAQQRLVLDIDGDHRPGGSESAMVVSEPFTIGGRQSNVMVEISTNVANSWVYVNLSLVNDDTGVAKSFGREVGLYSGRDSDGYWSEGSNWDRAYLPSVPAGTYVLVVEPEGPNPVAWRVRLTRDVPRPVWAWLALVAVLVPPVLFWIRKAMFENRRWRESDRAPAAAGGDDDD
jgi:hypothetical protein